jgi:hypothetical protein
LVHLANKVRKEAKENLDRLDKWVSQEIQETKVPLDQQDQVVRLVHQVQLVRLGQVATEEIKDKQETLDQQVLLVPQVHQVLADSLVLLDHQDRQGLKELQALLVQLVVLEKEGNKEILVTQESVAQLEIEGHKDQLAQLVPKESRDPLVKQVKYSIIGDTS